MDQALIPISTILKFPAQLSFNCENLIDIYMKVINSGGLPKLQVEYKNETKTFTPEEISSMVLVKMKVTLNIIVKISLFI